MIWIHWMLVLCLCGIAGKVHSTSTESNTNTTPTSDYDDDWDEDESTEIDDDGRIYKNPRNSPSTLCPRDEEQATLLGQKCLRKCSSDEDCKSKKKKCLCDGACGMSCIKPDRECPEPEQISFGSVVASGRIFGARATYSCQHGYHVVGLQSRNCQADGHWAGSPPACKQNIYCLSPPAIDHARHNALPEQSTFDLDSTLQYYCHTGFVTNGFPRAKCLAIDGQASWYGPDISCEPRSCGPPSDISHGWHAGECYTFACRITYHCGEGFELVGRNERFCQADGTWSPKELPTCVLITAVQCPPPENPRHGKAIYTSCSYNSVVSYECKYGYTLVGETTRRCGADKKWSGSQPVCKEINCGHPGRLWNGWLENIEGGTGLGASIIFRCHEGTRLDGNSSTVCQIDGKWRYPPPKCLAPCVVPQVSQGKISLLSRNDTAPSSTVVQDGEALTVDCEPLYEFALSDSPVVCNNGTWTHIPKCQPARCKYLPKSPKNGMVIAPKMEHGMKARFKCKDGFELKGNTFIDCSFGNWTGEFPICQEVYCPFPGLVDNGKILLVGNMGLYDYRPYVRKVTNNKQIMYDCDKGYVLSEGPPGATCIGGNWSPNELPKCTLGQHPRLRWSRKKRHTLITRYKRPDILRFENSTTLLHVNDTIEGNKTIVKRALRTGSTSSSSRALGLGLKSNRNQPNARRKNKQTNFDVKPEKKNGCFPVDDEETVEAIKIIKYGFDNSIPYSFGTVIKMTCRHGFGLNVPSNITVKCFRGKWKPVRPKCLTAPCALPKIDSGEYLSGYREGMAIGNGSSVAFQCEKDMSNSTVLRVFCINHELKPENPTCTPGYDFKFNASKVIPYYLGGSDIVIGGDINVLEYGGTGKSCGPPTSRVQGSLIYRNGEILSENDETFPDDTEVTFSCIESIVGEKTTWKIICDDGKWVGRSLTCDTEELIYGHNANSNNTCLFRNHEANVDFFYNDKKIEEQIAEFADDTVLVSRCVDIGKFAMIGTNIQKCLNGKWDNPQPSCFGLNQEFDYSMEKPPTILFRHELGPIAQSNEGKLIVYPGVILHMECLWIRRFGIPKWTIGHNHRQYPQSWTTDPGRDSQLEYRLSIYYASKEDSGLFTCETPARYMHSVEVIVKAVHCPHIPKRRGLTASTEDTKMSTHVTFNCENGNALTGPSEIVCLPSGNWNSSFPICESVECGEVGGLVSTNLTMKVIARDIGGRAVFSCAPGYSLQGPQETTCLSNGDWATPFPSCVEVQCENPKSPENGFYHGTGAFKVGDVVQYNCNTDYVMEGQSVSACQDSGRWSGTLPKCIPACSYPGTTISGKMSSVKFYYKMGENITFSCENNLVLKGASMLKCLKNGKWSNTIPTCEAPNSNQS
ncbi:sushi, von Willebrand factor type A, EGF and pentraxin domain-containing protein 1-like isoform X3 [Photinus pyralis]|uniref:sushi, von Willebrand factor type A, EGF and pentraxin domain-containing protein 1-like isoform X3 n=1 Tax=Photinus pyralis TaxID=7054 RepID=UPI0012672A64|nr:sushi, von Willebrand factor type A, EGF and pentraxin domain-containing protein 1-like isoform X3 [Photinus pyralis]